MLEHAIDGALVLAFLDGLTFVVLSFTTTQSDNDLGESPLIDKQAQWHNGNTRLLGVTGDATDLLAVKEQLAVAVGGMVVIGPVTVFSNVHVLDPDLTIDDHAIGIGQAAFALTDGLDFGTSEHDTSGERLDNLVVERRLTVLDIDSIVVIASCHKSLFILIKSQTNPERTPAREAVPATILRR